MPAPVEETASAKDGLLERLRAFSEPRFEGYEDPVRLGGGGQAEVFRARGPGGPVAIKRWLAPGIETRARAAREAQTLLALPPHAHLVRALGTTRDDRGAECTVLELVEGRVLADLVRADGPLPAERVTAVGLALAEALGHLHRHGLRHGDVTPQNVVVRADGTPVLLDLGVARLAGTSAPSAGTIPYMAPEQIGFSRPETNAPVPVDARADLYGLGATLYEALTGGPPWGHDQGAHVRWHHGADAFERPRDPAARERLARSPALAAALAACLAGPPERRPRDASALASALRAPPPQRGGLLALALFLVLTAVFTMLLLLERRESVEDPAATERTIARLLERAPVGRRAAPGSAAAIGSWIAEASAVRSATLPLADALARARSERALVHEGYDAAWARCRASVAANASYSGLALEPLPGLVPLEPDPHTGYWELWHPESGERPVRDATGTLAVGELTGIVFVLVPGGVARIGDPAGPPTEEAPEEIPLAPFLLAKHEMTQGQWTRLGRENPSRFAPGREQFVHAGSLDEEWTLARPVERVSWIDARDALGPRGLTLPTSVQWEWAARGAGARRYPWGAGPPDEARCVWRGHVPWGGVEPRAAGRPAGASWCGIEDMAGNVSEWCLDFHFEDKKPWSLDPATGYRLGFEPILWRRSVRGGQYASLPSELVLAHVGGSEPGERNIAIGLRAARRLEPEPGPFDPYAGRTSKKPAPRAVAPRARELVYDGAGSPARVGFTDGWPYREDDPPGFLRQLSDMKAPFATPGSRPWRLPTEVFSSIASHETGWAVEARIEALRVEGPTARWAIFVDGRDRHAGFQATFTPSRVFVFDYGSDPDEAPVAVAGRGPRRFRIEIPRGGAGERRQARVWVDGEARGGFSMKPLAAGDGELRFGDGSRGAGGEALFDEVKLLRLGE